jgi:OOP family OmpA-OmpF porin
LVLTHLAALPGGKDFSTDVAGPSPIEQCRNSLAAFPHDAVAFDAATHFAKGTDAAIDTLASDLGACPAARVDVEGYTSSDGEAAANMALSVARAEAVVDALVKRGVDAQRLYAIGYGETLPLVPNTTPANKAMNRRIEIKLEDGSAK